MEADTADTMIVYQYLCYIARLHRRPDSWPGISRSQTFCKHPASSLIWLRVWESQVGQVKTIDVWLVFISSVLRTVRTFRNLCYSLRVSLSQCVISFYQLPWHLQLIGFLGIKPFRPLSEALGSNISTGS